MINDYVSVTEIAGDEVTQEQLDRLCNRYYWTKQYCKDKDVVEAACGSGQGLGYLKGIAKSFEAGDYSEKMIEIAKSHYNGQISLQQFDALDMPFKNQCKDVIILFEAIYYLQDATKFAQECARVLRPNGVVLVVTANKDLYDFNPSPYSYHYYNPLELNALFSDAGFSVKCYGGTPLREISFKQKMLRPIKKTAVRLGIMPKTMSGKKLLKRLVFGRMVTIPAEINNKTAIYVPPTPISCEQPDRQHKVIYCEATKIS